MGGWTLLSRATLQWMHASERRCACSHFFRLLAVNGLKAAKAAGCYAVAVATSLPPHLLQPHADAVLGALADIDLAALAAAAAGQAAGGSSAAAGGGAAAGAAAAEPR